MVADDGNHGWKNTKQMFRHSKTMCRIFVVVKKFVCHCFGLLR